MVRVIALGRLAVVGHHAQTHPNATMLHRQRKKVVQRRQLVAVHAGAVGETGKDLVFPALRVPRLGRRIGKFLELPADTAHVSRRSHDDGIGCGQRFPAAIGQIAFGADFQQFCISALGH